MKIDIEIELEQKYIDVIKKYNWISDDEVFEQDDNYVIDELKLLGIAIETKKINGISFVYLSDMGKKIKDQLKEISDI